MRNILLIIAMYFSAFLVLVIAGHEPEWPDEFGFIYSRDERTDEILGVIFDPALNIAQMFASLQRLKQPQRKI